MNIHATANTEAQVAVKGQIFNKGGLLLLAKPGTAQSRSGKLLEKGLRDANVSVALVTLKSRNESLHANANSVVQLLALNKGDVARSVPRKPVECRDDALVQAMRSALDKGRLSWS